LPHGDKGIGLGDQRLSQHSAGAFSCKFAQWIVNHFRPTQRDDRGISRHGVSLLSGGSGRLHTRLDTPPSINRRHPHSSLALHGDMWCVPLDAKLAFIYPPWCDYETIRRLDAIGYELIECPREEIDLFPTNAITIEPRRVIMNATAQKTKRLLEK